MGRPTFAALSCALSVLACGAPKPAVSDAPAPPREPPSDAEAPPPSASIALAPAPAPIADASVTVPADPNATPLAFLVAVPPPPWGPKGKPNTITVTPHPSSLGGVRGPGSSADAICGARTTTFVPRANVAVGLAPRPGLAPADEKRATSAISLLRARTRRCLQMLLATDPTLDARVLHVDAHAPGAGAKVEIAIGNTHPSVPSESACLTREIATVLGGDATPATLAFDLATKVE